MKKKTVIDNELLQYLYVDCGMSGQIIGDLLGCSAKVVYTNLRDYNIDIRNKTLVDKDLLYYLYITCEMSVPEIVTMLKCGRMLIYNNLRNYGIITRSTSDRIGIKHPFFGKHLTEKHKLKLSESHKGNIPTEETRQKLSIASKGRKHTEKTKQKMSILASGKNNSNYGKYTSEETKQKLRLKNSGKNNARYGKSPSPLAGTGKGSYYNISNEIRIWTRSTYEYRVVDSLIKSNIIFEYETTKFTLEHTTYTPDIYIKEYDIFFEIKGYLSNKYVDKYKEFIKLYPDINIRMLFKNDIEYIKNNIKNNIDINWKTVGKQMSEVLECYP